MASLGGLVNILIAVLYPIAYPISKILDIIFGHEEEDDISRNELQALMILQSSGQDEEMKKAIRQSSAEMKQPESEKLSKDEARRHDKTHAFAKLN